MHSAVSFTRRTALLGMAGLAFAPPLMARDGGVILTLVKPDGEEVSFTDAQLAELPWEEILTNTRWTEGKQQFRGPLVSAVFDSIGLSQDQVAGLRMVMTALNEFVVEMPAADTYTYEAMLAREANGTPMRVRDKGPLWLVFPRDDIAALEDPIMDERWIWQIAHIRLIE